MSTAIEFSHVSKQYRLGLVSTKTLSHDIRRFWITNVLGKEDPYLKIGETNGRASICRSQKNFVPLCAKTIAHPNLKHNKPMAETTIY